MLEDQKYFDNLASVPWEDETIRIIIGKTHNHKWVL